MDVTTRNQLEARWEARLALLPPAAQALIRNAPPPTEAQRATIAASLSRPRSEGVAA